MNLTEVLECYKQSLYSMIVVGIQRTRILTGMQAVKTVSQAHTGRRLEVIYFGKEFVYILFMSRNFAEAKFKGD